MFEITWHIDIKMFSIKCITGNQLFAQEKYTNDLIIFDHAGIE
jgi:hypothetical protein